MAYTDNFVAEFLPLVEDLVGAENATYNKLIFQKAFLASDITKDHAVVTGVREGSLVPILDKKVNWEAFPFIDASSCDTTECDLNANYSAIKWRLGLISCRVPICLRTFNDNFLIFWNSYKMLNPAKVDSKYLKTAILQYITDLLVNSLEAAKWRVEYFAEDGHSSPLLDGFDGWFAQAGAVPGLVVPIAKNAGANYAAQRMTFQEIYDTLDAMETVYDEQEWADDTPKEYRMPKSLAKTLARGMNKLKETACCDGIEKLNPDAFINKAFTYDNLSFRGKPIKPMPEWDAIFNNVGALNGNKVAGAKRDNPNRILLINKQNMLIGTEEKEDLSLFDVFYDKKDKKVYFDLEAYLGAAIPLREYVYAV